VDFVRFIVYDLSLCILYVTLYHGTPISATYSVSSSVSRYSLFDAKSPISTTPLRIPNGVLQTMSISRGLAAVGPCSSVPLRVSCSRGTSEYLLTTGELVTLLACLLDNSSN